MNASPKWLGGLTDIHFKAFNADDAVDHNPIGACNVTSKYNIFQKCSGMYGWQCQKPQKLGVETGHTNTAQITPSLHLFFMHNGVPSNLRT